MTAVDELLWLELGDPSEQCRLRDIPLWFPIREDMSAEEKSRARAGYVQALMPFMQRLTQPVTPEVDRATPTPRPLRGVTGEERDRVRVALSLSLPIGDEGGTLRGRRRDSRFPTGTASGTGVLRESSFLPWRKDGASR